MTQNEYYKPINANLTFKFNSQIRDFMYKISDERFVVIAPESVINLPIFVPKSVFTSFYN